MIPFDPEALWAKSSLFIGRGLKDRSSGDYSGYQLWAALALELLGKAALAHIHPALVADPTHQESLFAACGRPSGTDRRTITAKTVFDRLSRLHKRFDKDAQDFALRLANRRNGELHSGSADCADVDLEAWGSHYWRVAAIVLEAQGRSLAQWVGEEEAKVAEQVIKHATNALTQAIIGRIRMHREQFDATNPPGSESRTQLLQLHQHGRLVQPRDFSPRQWEQTFVATCPSCGCDGLIAGNSTDEERVEDNDPDRLWYEPWRERFLVTCSSEAFRCRACGLKIDGVDEIEAAGIRSEFEVEEDRDVEYEPEYGND